MTKKQVQPSLKKFTAWTLSNWGNPWYTFRTRRECIKEAEEATGRPWREIRDHFSVAKVRVTPL